MAKQVEGEIVIAYPGTHGGPWQVLSVTEAQARYIYGQLEQAFQIRNGWETTKDRVELSG